MFAPEDQTLNLLRRSQMNLKPLFAGLVLALATQVPLPVLSQESAMQTADRVAAAVVGDISIFGPFTRATLPNAPVAGGFLSIVNSGDDIDRLVSAHAAISVETQIHEMAVESGVMKMRQLADGLEIPAGTEVALAPGGYHLMFMSLLQPINEGDLVAVTLVFEKAGEIQVDLIAGGLAADMAADQMPRH
jgi:copper(I)-binding protein